MQDRTPQPPLNEPVCRECGAELGKQHSATCLHWPLQRVKERQTMPPKRSKVMEVVKIAQYGILTSDQRLLGEVFPTREAAEKRAKELGPHHQVVLVDLVR